jgi:hypothetical protein
VSNGIPAWGWIGDNVLPHLEEVHYCPSQESAPGCILFLYWPTDWPEKAYDRLDRGWLMLCMERMGFPASRLWH